VKNNNGNRVMLESAEDELRRAILAERAGIKNAGQRRQRAEIEVEKWRQRVRVNDSNVRRAFGPDDEQEGLS
jgi:hypothetical protein